MGIATLLNNFLIALTIMGKKPNDTVNVIRDNDDNNNKLYVVFSLLQARLLKL